MKIKKSDKINGVKMKFIQILNLFFLFIPFCESYSQVTDEWIRVDSTFMSTGYERGYFSSNYSNTNLLSNYSNKLIYYNNVKYGYIDRDFNWVNSKLFLNYTSDSGNSWHQIFERSVECKNCYLLWYSLNTPSENKIVISEDSAEQFQYFDAGKMKEFYKRHARLLISDDRGNSYRVINFDSNTVITTISMADENKGVCFLDNLSNPFYINPKEGTECLYTNDGWNTYKNIFFGDSIIITSAKILTGGKMILSIKDTINQKNEIYYTINQGISWNSYELKIDKKFTIEEILDENVIFFIYSDSLYPVWSDYTKIIRTTDGGYSFDTVWKKNKEFAYYFFKYLDSTNYILCYYNNYPNDLNFYIIKTTDSGITWVEQFYHTLANELFLYKPQEALFIDKNLIYVRTNGGGLTPGTNIFKYTGDKTLKPILPIIAGVKNSQNLYKTDSIQVSWNKIVGSTSYHIEVNGISYSDFLDADNLIEHRIHNALSTNVTDTSIWLTNLNKYYYYTVVGKARNSTTTSIEGEAYFRTEKGLLDKPRFISPDTTYTGYYKQDSILIKWTSVKDADSYDLVITYNNSKFYENIPIIRVNRTNDTCYLFKGLLDHSKYGIFIRAVNENEISVWNNKFIYTNVIGNYTEDIFKNDVSAFIYPNPFSSSFNIEFINLTVPVINIELYDMFGIKIFSKQFENISEPSQRITIYLNDEIKTGCYFLVIITGNNTFYKKIIKID